MEFLQSVKKMAHLNAVLQKKNRQYIFCGLACLMCVGVLCIIRPIGVFFASVGAFLSFMIFIRLRFATIEIESGWVRFGWAMLNFGLFALLLNVFPNRIVGFSAALIANILLYGSIPYLSGLWGLTSSENNYDRIVKKIIRLNRILLSLLINVIFLAIYVLKEEDRKNDDLFAKTEYVRVESWDKKIIRGNTYYIVKLPEKTIAINPRKYPQIRKINSKTKIKVLTSVATHSSFPKIQKMEILNY